MTNQKHQFKCKTCHRLSHSLVQHVCTQHTHANNTYSETKFKLVQVGLFSLNLPFLNSSPSSTLNSSSWKTTRQILPLLMCEATLRIHRVGLHYWKESLSLQLKGLWVCTCESLLTDTISCQHFQVQNWYNEWTSWKYLNSSSVDNVYKTSFYAGCSE